MPRIGGQLPDDYGLSMTVHVPSATADNPVNTNDLLVFSNEAPYAAVPASDGDPIQLVAKHPVSDALTPLGVYCFGEGYSRVHKFAYSGTAPTVGASVVADGQGGVRAMATGEETAGAGSRVMYVDTARQFVEVLR